VERLGVRADDVAYPHLARKMVRDKATSRRRTAVVVLNAILYELSKTAFYPVGRALIGNAYNKNPNGREGVKKKNGRKGMQKSSKIKRRNEMGPRREEEETGRGCSAGAVSGAVLPV
jgi:hypothetical protein